MSRFHQLLCRNSANLDDRLRLSLHLTFSVHLAYIFYKSVAAVWYHSAWLGATAAYYMALCTARFLLLRGARCKNVNLFREYRTYRFCGGMLLVLTLAIGTVNFYTIRDNQALRYPWHLIYGAAAYTFYSLTMALIWLFRGRRDNRPLYSANKLLSLSAALVSLFSLQMALLAAFGNGANWEKPLNIATGFLVLLLVAVIAVHMLRKGTLAIQSLHQNTP